VLTREELQKLAPAYEAALAKSPRDWVLHEGAAQLFSAIGDFTNATIHCEAITKLLPHSRDAWA
jgi:hypothetical protein